MYEYELRHPGLSLRLVWDMCLSSDGLSKLYPCHPCSQSLRIIIFSIGSVLSPRSETSVELYFIRPCFIPLWWILLMWGWLQSVSELSWYHMLWWNQFSISLYDLQTSPHTTSRCLISNFKRNFSNHLQRRNLIWILRWNLSPCNCGPDLDF